MPCPALFLVLVVSGALPPFDGPTPYAEEIHQAVESVRAVYAVPPQLVMAVIRRESAFNPRALSAVGAIGLMQVMPFNAAKLGVTEAQLWNPATNILAGTRLLAVLLKHYDGDLISALAAYNARPRPKGAPLPANEETPAYVAAVLQFFAAYRAVAPATPLQTSDGPQKSRAPMINHFRSTRR
jgi:soluble lytic murein transglycosylase-like protein